MLVIMIFYILLSHCYLDLLYIVDGSSVSQSRTASRGTAVEDLSVRAREISLV